MIVSSSQRKNSQPMLRGRAFRPEARSRNLAFGAKSSPEVSSSTLYPLAARQSRVLLMVLIILCATAAQAAEQSAVVRRVLDNGLTVLVKPEKGSGLVAVTAIVRAGAGQESIQNAGIGNFVTNLVLASTRLSSAEEVAKIADEVGGNIEAQWNPDFTVIRAVTTSARFNEAMNLIGECLTEANFESKWVEQIRTDLLRQLKEQSDSLFNRTYDTMRELLYEDNGYRRPRLGFERTVRVAASQDLQKFYSNYYVPNNTVIAVVGDVTVERVLDRAGKAYAGVEAKSLPLDRGVQDERLDRPKLKSSEAELSIAYLMVGWLAPAVGTPDYPAMAVASNALGGGKGSIMFQELRQKRGIGYDVGTIYPRQKYQSHVLAYITTDPLKSGSLFTARRSLEDVKAALIDEVEKLKSQPLSAQNLERARGYTIGSYALEHQRMHERAFHLAWLEAVGVGYDYDRKFAEEVQKVSAEDVMRVARKYFTNCATVLLVPKTNSPASSE